MPERHAQVLVVGGGLGGVAAAIAALRRGCTVLLAEPTDWLGGQLTSQVVPADESVWIDYLDIGATSTYFALRNRIRELYRSAYPLSARAAGRLRFNPGGATVSRISCEPRVALAALESLLAPLAATGRLTTLLRHAPVAAECEGDRVVAVTLRGRDTGADVVVGADYVIDATETGDLLPLLGVEHVVGAESQAEFGEPHAPATQQPAAVQAVTHVFALDHRPGEEHTIDRPAGYDRWRGSSGVLPGEPLLSLTTHSVRTGEPVRQRFVPNPGDDPAADFAMAEDLSGDLDLWRYRRLLAKDQYLPGSYDSDVIAVNWPMNDYWQGEWLDRPQGLAEARELSLSALYWLQTEAPRPDGGTGWPGLRLRPDVTGTADGLAMAPYVREGRRIRAVTTVTENDVSLAVRGARGATRYEDSVGVGSYRIDLHPVAGGGGQVDVATTPFELPLGALVPVRLTNLLAGAKNIGTTHITNGCYRLHPVEWGIGEAAGALAAHCVATGRRPHQLCAAPGLAARFTAELDAAGVQRHWPDLARRLGPLLPL